MQRPPSIARPLRTWTAVGVTSLVAVATLIPRWSTAQAPCRDCASGVPQDASGCCPATPAPAKPQPPSSNAPARPAAVAMATVPGGSFTMGDRGDAVTVATFSLDVTEVTVDAYTACAQSGQCMADHAGQWTRDGITFTAETQCNYGVEGRGNHPMNCVDWRQSATYCHAHGKRLPTEEEWEWAARGGSQRRTYPWGDSAPAFQLCWSGMTKRDGTCPVGSFREGDAPGGIHDLAGNVDEWTSSDFRTTESYSNAHDARVMGKHPVYRGGDFGLYDASYFRAAHRMWITRSYRDSSIGFRCAR
jgi:formylglycine-generating enzyme required for sulfatase activity